MKTIQTIDRNWIAREKAEEVKSLMEVGFEYHAEVEGHKLFGKRKPYNG